MTQTTTAELDTLIANVRASVGELLVDLEQLAVEVDPTADPPPPALSDEQKAAVRDIVADLTDGHIEDQLGTLSDAAGD